MRILAGLSLAVLAHAATPLFYASFDHADHGWAVLSGVGSPDTSVLHDGRRSFRVERGQFVNASVSSAPVSLTIGKRYELSGWIRTEALTVRDSGHSAVEVGATFTMASMPFDVHSVSLGGTRPWTRVSLRFVASRALDQILFTIGDGFQGKAWFEGVSLDEISSRDEWPVREAVRTFGPAYRYPAAGWIYLHIEGQPYERGYQHGFLMAREIPEYMDRVAADLGVKPEQGWTELRTTANALFLRGFDREILEEMRGIADGATAGGARWLGRPVDLIDVVVANTAVEMGELRAAVRMTPTGLEGLHLEPPSYYNRKRDSALDHCSAFAATGPATVGGKMVIGHVTWWPLTLAEQTNVMLDIKPASGHRMLIQSYPGGIESGTDWYQNDAGVVLTETTIRQTPFDIQGTPVAFRARMASQYGGNIDEVVKQLGTRNNGLYTNEWLIGDARNNEIAMYELGTHHTRLWRSSRNEWFGNTPGFYWGNNNAKDLTVKQEYLPDPQGSPEYVPYVPSSRDLAWTGLYNKSRGQIDEQFGFLAFRTPPLVSASTMDAKVTTSDMAMHMMTWAAFGKPNEREWVASTRGESYAKNDGLFPSGYHLFHAEPSESLRAAVQENEAARVAGKTPATEEKTVEAETGSRGRRRNNAALSGPYRDRLWKGWILPASDADTWFAAGSAAYLNVLQAENLDEAMEAQRAAYRGLKLAPADALHQFRLQEAKGVLFLDALRRKLGDDPFLQLMRGFFQANTTHSVTAESFLKEAGVSFDFVEPGPGPLYVMSDIYGRLQSAVIVYGTVREAGANRYAAGEMQRRYLDLFEDAVRIYKDFEFTDDLLKHHDVVFIGRPEANSALASLSERIGLDYRGANFHIGGKDHADERQALLLAAANPADAAHMVLIIAGNDALRTVKAAASAKGSGEYAVLEPGQKLRPQYRKSTK